MENKDLIIKLRKATGAGIADITEALIQSGGNEGAAIEFLRKRGQKIAAKRSDRQTGEGWIGSYVHSNGKIASFVKLYCETDFVARNKDFQTLAHDLAMQVAASSPIYLKSDDIPMDVIEKEKEIYREEIVKQGEKPEDIVEKIISGKLEKFYSENCLLNQKFIKDDSKTIANLIDEATAKIGEKIEIGEFSKIEI